MGPRQLQPSNFSFHGFGELRQDELRKISRLTIRDDEPVVSIVDAAVYIPDGYKAEPGRLKFAGGILTADGQPVDTAQMHRKGGKHFAGLFESLPVKPERELDEEVVYLGLLFNHYGRILLESLARVWHLNHVDPSMRVVFNYANASPELLAEWVPRLLALFGIPPERILILDVPTRLRRVIVPEPLFEQLHSAHEAMFRPHRELASRSVGNLEPTRQPVYLSRRLLTSRQRPVIGEAELEDVLRENGFAIAHPETMTFEDQIRLMNAHTDIFSSLGSAAHSVIFALNSPRLHLLASRDAIPANYFLCSALAAAPTTFINCLGSGGRSSPKDERRNRRAEKDGAEVPRPAAADGGPQATPQLVDFPSIVAYLDHGGFLTRRLRASLAVRNPPPQEHYDEAWVYARVRKASGNPGSLPAEIESEAVRWAERSWPISLMLARYYARQADETSTVKMFRQFARLVATEPMVNRLVQHRGDVELTARLIAVAFGPEAVRPLAAMLADSFLIEWDLIAKALDERKPVTGW